MCIEKAKAFLLSPTNAFKKEKGTSLEDAFVYFLKILAVYAVLLGLVNFAFSMNAIVLVTTIVVVYIGTTLGIIISGLWLHLWAYIVGARKGFEQTLKTVLYASTPTLLLGWTIVLMPVGAVWSIVLQIFGLTKLQGLTGERAVLAVLLPIVVILAAVFILGLAIIMTMLPMMMSGGISAYPGMV